jgi:hypothetical protein
MKSLLGTLARKAFAWLVPHIVDEVQKELEKKAAAQSLRSTPTRTPQNRG